MTAPPCRCPHHWATLIVALVALGFAIATLGAAVSM